MRVVSAMPLVVSSSTLRVVVIEMRERTNGSRISVVLIAPIAEINFLEPAIIRYWADLLAYIRTNIRRARSENTKPHR
jgi:hypothetical protein